jgi:hypothetical protein
MVAIILETVVAADDMLCLMMTMMMMTMMTMQLMMPFVQGFQFGMHLVILQETQVVCC